MLEELGRGHEIVERGEDLTIYHVGNNGLHWEIYQRAIEKPGIVILHDAVLHHLLLGQLTREQYVEEFVFNYGEWHRQTAEKYWERRGQSAADGAYFRRPMLRRLAERARAIVVHNPAAEQLVREHAPEARLAVVPHLFVPPREYSYRELDEYRERELGVAPGEVLFGVLGHLRESKRIATVLGAVDELRRQGLTVRLLVQGEFVGAELERALTACLARPWVVRRGFLEEDEWWKMAWGLDVCVNLRWPSAGESSGIATRLMGIGRPVLVTRGAETAELPEVAVVKVDAGLAEKEQLTGFLAWLVLNKEARLAIGRHAAIHIGQFHEIGEVVRQVVALA